MQKATKSQPMLNCRQIATALTAFTHRRARGVGVAAGSIWWQDEQAQQLAPVSLGRVMRTVSKVLLALCLLWNVGALARQPTPFLSAARRSRYYGRRA